MDRAMKNSLKWNLIMNLLLAASALLFPILLFPYAARVLQPENIGRVSFAESVIAYFLLLSQLGIPTYGVREISRAREDRQESARIAGELFGLNLLMAAISFMLLLAGTCFIPRFREDRALFLITGAGLFLNALGMEWLYRGRELYVPIAVRSFSVKAVCFVLVFLSVRDTTAVLRFACLYMTAIYGAGILNFIGVRKYLGTGEPMHKLNISRHFPAVFVFFAMACATTVYTHLDAVMLGFISGNMELGFYNAAIKIKVLLVSLVTSIGTVLLPRITMSLKKGDLAVCHRLVDTTRRFVWDFSVPMTVFFILFARPTLQLLSGERFLPAIPAMRWILLTLLPIGMSNLIGIEILVPLGREKAVLIAELIGAGVDLSMNLILIPQYGAAGAAVGTVAAELAVLLFQLWTLHRIALNSWQNSNRSDALARMLGLWEWDNIGRVVITAILSVLLTGRLFENLLLKSEEISIVSLTVGLFGAFLLFAALYLLGLLLLREKLLMQCLEWMKTGGKEGANGKK